MIKQHPIQIEEAQARKIIESFYEFFEKKFTSTHDNIDNLLNLVMRKRIILDESTGTFTYLLKQPVAVKITTANGENSDYITEVQVYMPTVKMILTVGDGDMIGENALKMVAEIIKAEKPFIESMAAQDMNNILNELAVRFFF